ncbi:UDP-N-acetylmuramoyl-tripeptide--D-alanyl-D-alanine ligase [Fulvivirga sedimenti]|uniref:UDP-N-acetylmuramoyl-tripeptide--D-alanyl-D-alanine ligase n=1 Tax=Fulvivirga sedimenti TaxID=2879465 RepID=A0A9X1HX61_9BACT|nr:UDP-N-acetylmuramoyl-tripeptide--D-alanyl-D-alanine ligase [Fulvivirga sedimenti]MCA6079000.1 UDP-N-acetylmuramoyl-tripeptide--D-alanyl-D-alanine ligase [Fulvivirga sedimenti]
MIEKLYTNYLQYRGVSTDTRKISEGDIFFALKGPNFNANAFAEDALNKGASLAVIDDEAYAQDERYVVVEDTLSTLQQLATHHRKQLTIPVIGLTGSNGKTTTKELIDAVLSKKYRTLATRGNLNNHIGVPLTILSIKPEHEIAIIEMGANHQGEIARLCEIALPDHGLITNIGKAHIEGFGGFEGVIKGKSELYQHLINYDGVVWINSNNPILSNMAKRFKTPLFYPNPGDFYHCEFIEANPHIVLKAESGNTVHTQLIGSYNFENMAVALCIGKYFNVPARDAESAIASYNPVNNRSQVISKEDFTIIMDAYNANPSSMKSALENLLSMKGKKKAVILGDMKELGVTSEEEHRNIGKWLKTSGIDTIYLYGNDMAYAAEECGAAKHFNEKSALKLALHDEDFTDYLILLKGSRSMGLEEVLEDL